MIRRRLLSRFTLACFAAGLTPTVARPATPLPVEAALPAPGSAAAREPSAAPGAPREPGELARLIEFGSSLAERGDFVGAESALRQVLNDAGASMATTKLALLALAQMHRREGALTKAAAIYERYLKDYPGDEKIPEALLELGRTLRGLGVYRLALARFYSVINSTLKLPGGDLERYQALARTAQFEIAETHFQAGDYAEAAKFYTRLGLLDLAATDRGQVQFKSAHAQRLQGDLDGAVATLRSFLEQWPQDENVPEARYLLAITYRELNRPQEAFAVTLELLQSAQADSAAQPKRWAYWQRRTGNQLANDFFESGDTLNARAIYAGLLELSAEPAWRLPTIYQLALCDERLGQLERARASYQTIMDATGTAPAGEWAELARMAGWRLEHLAWREQATRRANTLFETETGKQAAAANSTATRTREPAPDSPGT